MLQSLFSRQGLFLSVLKSNLHYYFQLQFNNLWNYLVSYLQYVRQASLHCNEVWFNTVIIVAVKGLWEKDSCNCINFSHFRLK